MPYNTQRIDAQSGRKYWWRGESFDSVTSIIGSGVPKPALIGWAAKFTAEYAVGHFKEFDRVGGRRRQVAAIEWLKNARLRKTAASAELGTTIHALVEAYILGAPFPELPGPERAVPARVRGLPRRPEAGVRHDGGEGLPPRAWVRRTVRRHHRRARSPLPHRLEDRLRHLPGGRAPADGVQERGVHRHGRTTKRFRCSRSTDARRCTWLRADTSS